MAQDDPALKDPKTLRREAAATRARISANVDAFEQRVRSQLPGAPGNRDGRATGREAIVDPSPMRQAAAFQILWAGAVAGYKLTRWWRHRNAGH